jgi:tetratricopeptide (TPR) repeat protein
MPKTIPLWQIILSVAVLFDISAAAWRWRKTKPYLLFGWLWFLGTLMPVIGLVQVGGQAMADRYTYLPSIGFFMAVVFLVRDFFAKIQLPEKFTISLAAVILLVCMALTEWQLQFWRNSETLFRRAIAVTRNNDVALIDLGVALDVQRRFDEALVFYRQAEALDSTHFQLHNNLGNILGILGQHTDALDEYAQALAMRPDNAVLHTSAGTELAALSRYDDALKEFAVAEKLDPHDPNPYLETAKILFKLGYDMQAVNTFRIALNIAPDNYQNLATVAHYLAANKNAAARDGQVAFKLAVKANDLSNHSQPLVFDALGMACAELGDFTNAQACAQNAIDIAAVLHLKNVPEFQQRLELYKNHQPWRESFRDTNAVIKP